MYLSDILEFLEYLINTNPDPEVTRTYVDKLVQKCVLFTYYV